MKPLRDPILQDCARVIGRHPGVTTAFQVRLLNGLEQIDQELSVCRVVPGCDATPPTASDTPLPTAKGGKR